MLSTLWNVYLYQPLFNFLIWIYNNWTNMNFGWAVIYLTIVLRVLLLPLSLVSERNRVRNAELSAEIQRITKEYHGDAVLRKGNQKSAQKTARPAMGKDYRTRHPGFGLGASVSSFYAALPGKILKICIHRLSFPG